MEKIELGQHTKALLAGGKPASRHKRKPSPKTIERWIASGYCKTACGCRVEIDGYCEHGNPSLAIELGVV